MQISTPCTDSDGASSSDLQWVAGSCRTCTTHVACHTSATLPRPQFAKLPSCEVYTVLNRKLALVMLDPHYSRGHKLEHVQHDFASREEFVCLKVATVCCSSSVRHSTCPNIEVLWCCV